MLAFFRAHVRRETSLDEASVERLAAALTKAVNRMLVWDVPAESEAPDASRPKRKMPEVVASSAPVEPRTDRFNPYVFSALIVLAKSGREGLAKRLGEIKSAENLRALAEAQHLAVDPSLKRIDDIRRAVVASTEQRLADRKAAAS